MTATILLKGLGDEPSEKVDVPAVIQVIKRAAKKTKKKAKGKKKNAALHSKEDPNWITDEETLAVERAMYAEMGLEIDLDTYSSDIANTVVKAKRYFTEKDDGFAQPHVCEAGHTNHPGGTTKKAWKKLIDEVRLGNTKRMTWVGFSVEQLCILAEPLDDGDNYPHPMDFSFVLLRSRIDFLKETTLAPGGRPSHGNYVVIVGVPPALVDKHWGPLGRVFHGRFAGDLGILRTQLSVTGSCPTLTPTPSPLPSPVNP